MTGGSLYFQFAITVIESHRQELHRQMNMIRLAVE